MARISSATIAQAYKHPALSAKLAGLTYGSSNTPGWSRVRAGKTFMYKDAHHKTIRDPSKVSRITSLHIPPAWKEVWISPHPRSHLQATGVDIKGITQYRYHPKWNAIREVLKFYRLTEFADALPHLRAEIAKHLQEPDPTRTKVIATALTLIDQLALRIGNEDYAEANNTYGVTTLRGKHITVVKDHIELQFVGKSHQQQSFELTDKRLATALAQEMAIPGSKVFQYLDDAHKKHPLTASEVNAFIREITASDLTAKDFRTWIGTAEAYKLMKKSLSSRAEPFDEKSCAKALREIITSVAGTLGNTVSVCKAHYIHGDLQKIYLTPDFAKTVQKLRASSKRSRLPVHEAELALLLGRLGAEQIKQLRS